MAPIVIIPAARAAAAGACALRARPALSDFALAVDLTRSPTADERSIGTLIHGARLLLEMTLALSDWDLASESRVRSIPLERLFARSVSFMLERGRRVLASARGSGVAARGVLRTRLEPEDVVEVLAAVDGGGDITVRACVEHAAGGAAAFEELTCPLSSLIAGQNAAVTMLADGLTLGSPRERAMPIGPRILIGPTIDFPPLGSPLLPLPVVVTGEEPVWWDRAKTRRFVAPVWNVVQPPVGAQVDTSPFALRVRTVPPLVGTGRAALEGTLRISLDGAPPPGVLGELIAMREVTALLEVPYRVAGDPVTRVQIFDGAVTTNGRRVTVAFELLDDWVRLVYASLSVSGAFDRPVRVRVGYGFSAYVPLTALPHQGPQQLMDKAALTPIAVARGDGPAQPTLDADGTMHVRAAPVAFTAYAMRTPLSIDRSLRRPAGSPRIRSWRSRSPRSSHCSRSATP